MYIVREIFQLKFGHFRDAKALFEEAIQKELVPQSKSLRILSDFTGDSYRLIAESSYDTLNEFEKSLQKDMNQAAFQIWYTKFKEHVVSNHREILKVVM